MTAPKRGRLSDFISEAPAAGNPAAVADDGPGVVSIATARTVAPAVTAARTADQTREAMQASAAARAQPASGKKPARRRKATPAPPPGADELTGAHGRVAAARDSAADAPQEWQSFSIKLPVDLANELIARSHTDRRGMFGRGQKAAVCHYVQAALAGIPTDPAEAAALGLEYRRAHRGTRPGAGSGRRLHRDTAAAMSDLAEDLRLVPGTVRAWEVHAAAITRLLDDLAAGEDDQESAAVPAPPAP